MRHVCGKLLEANAGEAAWNYCAPVVDYDALRKETARVFADRAAEVQVLVTKLQKTQRAAEQALDKQAISYALDSYCFNRSAWHNIFPVLVYYRNRTNIIMYV